MWVVEKTEILNEWFAGLDELAKEDIYAIAKVLSEKGPALGRPYVDTVKGSCYPNMKELRVQSSGRPLRIFFAFDKNRKAILLTGGNKKGNKRFYYEMIPIADKLYTEYIKD